MPSKRLTWILLFVAFLIYQAPDSLTIDGWLDRVLPSPDAPVTPVNSELAKLVPAEHRAVVGAFYRDLATVVETADLATTDQLRAAHERAVKLVKQATVLADNGPLRDALNKRFAAALGMESAPLSAEKRTAFVKVCRDVASELGVR